MPSVVKLLLTVRNKGVVQKAEIVPCVLILNGFVSRWGHRVTDAKDSSR